MWVSLIQLPSLADKTEVLRSIDLNLQRTGGSDLAVLPEGVMHDFRPSVDLRDIAEPLDGPFVTRLQSLAVEHGTALIAGMWEPADEDRVHNTTVILDRNGKLIATYRKIHLFDSFGFSESDRVTAGPLSPVVADLDGFKLGLMTCYDLRFPELGRALVEQGADVLVVPAGWVAGDLKVDHWRTLLRARAIENTSYVVASCLSQPWYVGHSTVIDPMGVSLVELDDTPGEVSVDLDPTRVAEVRDLLPSLRHRRM